MADIVSNRKRSNVWLHFTPSNNDKAKCDICRMELSHKGGSTANLLRHLTNKHPSIDTGRSKNMPGRPAVTVDERATAGMAASVASTSRNVESAPAESHGSVSAVQPVSAVTSQDRAREMSTRDRVQSRMNHYVTRPTTVSQQKALDEAIAIMICKDYQPLKC
jgi:hypothetical protein